ncbi:hypothetical protein PT974_07687 [Cladobotryum mycophilum]|uniref:Nephrocystin 3-like N-terminal domain-containing protein n=1 Tax=Cladobotryum mycophilum TaxID=491253 RepID=A0ABR0SIR9_9HYPO
MPFPFKGFTSSRKRKSKGSPYSSVVSEGIESLNDLRTIGAAEAFPTQSSMSGDTTSRVINVTRDVTKDVERMETIVIANGNDRVTDRKVYSNGHLVSAETDRASIQSEGTTIGSSASSGQPNRGNLVMTSISNLFKRVRGVGDKVLGDYQESAAVTDDTIEEKMNLDLYLSFIAKKRLISQPCQGSDWDRVLFSAQSFGLQICSFGDKIDTFADGGKTSSAAALLLCKALLQVGRQQAKALLPTFTALYEFSILLSNVSQVQDLNTLPPGLQEAVTDIFCDLIELIRKIVTRYQQKISDLKTGVTARISFDEWFGKDIRTVWESKKKLFNLIWEHNLAGREKEFSMSLQKVMTQLGSPFSQNINHKIYDEVDEHLDRAEDTCDWFKDHLSQLFNSSEKTLCVTGAASSGKTILAEYAEERLARTFDQRAYSVLRCDFAYDDPEATSVAFLKNILSQLLEQNVGNLELFRHIVDALWRNTNHAPLEEIEQSLWTALHLCLKDADHRNTTFVIIADGCDNIVGGLRGNTKFHEDLQNCVAPLSRARVITFGRQVPQLTKDFKHLEITVDTIERDIDCYFEEIFSQLSQRFDIDVDGDEMIDSLVRKANGDWLWAFYAGRLLAREESADSILRVSENLKQSISDVLYKFVGALDLEKMKMLKTLLSVMLVTTRPLSIVELSVLLSLDLKKGNLPKILYNVAGLISETCKDIIMMRNGYLHFRTEVVRLHLRTELGVSFLSKREANRQLTLMILLYAKLNLPDAEPTVHVFSGEEVRGLLKDSLLRYAVENWVVHFQASAFVSVKNKITLDQEFCDAFPESVMFSLLERACWTNLYTSQDLASFHKLALEVRMTCFGDEHFVVFDSFITLGYVHYEALQSKSDGARYYYSAIQAGRKLLSEKSIVLEHCIRNFLHYTKDTKFTERNDLVGQREEILLLMIDICERKKGFSNAEVMTWYDELIRLYRDIREEDKVGSISLKQRAAAGIKHNTVLREPINIGKQGENLDICLNGGDFTKFNGTREIMFETSESEETQHIISIQLARWYAEEKELVLAERIYASLWQQVTLACHANSPAGAHIAKINIALEYIKFLRTQKRTEEATNILICLWAEYEYHTLDNESLLLLIRELGKVCRSFGLNDVAVNILSKVWNWFKSIGKGDNEEALETTRLITDVIDEITTNTIRTTTTTTTTITTVNETDVEEIFECHLNRCRDTKPDGPFFSACMALVNLYSKEENWREAEEVMKRALGVTWGAILGSDIRIKLCPHSVKENLVIARRLAGLYACQSFFKTAEKLHLQIFYACLDTLDIEDAFVYEATKTLIGFYEEHRRHNEVINTLAVLVERYRNRFGDNHRLTVNMLYTLAAQIKALGRQDAYERYQEICDILNRGQDYCHHEAFEAGRILCRHYRSRGIWDKLQQICASMWETIARHREDLEIDKDTIKMVYESYRQALESDDKVSFSLLYKLTTEYKQVIKAVCGAASFELLNALIALGVLCEKNEDNYTESIDIYEDVLNRITTTDTITTTDIKKTVENVKSSLSKIYMKTITSDRGVPENSRITIERAIEIYLEAYDILKFEFGWWHQKTLTRLDELATLYLQLNTTESRSSIFQLLDASFKGIIVTKIENTKLFEAAKALAAIFVKVSMVEEGQRLLDNLRHVIVFQGNSLLKDQFPPLAAYMTKDLFVFLIAFEHGLSNGSTDVSCTKIMAETVLEALLFEQYTIALETRGLGIILERGSKLRSFWETHQRYELLKSLDQRLFELFMQTYAHCFSGLPNDQVRLFYECVLTEISKGQSSSQIDLQVLALRAINKEVKALLDDKKLHQANQLSRCVLSFSTQLSLYHDRDCINYGYRLAVYLADAGESDATDDDSVIKTQLLDASRNVTDGVIAAFKSIQMEFTNLEFKDLSGLIRLFGKHQAYAQLEHLLLQLWEAREELQCKPSVITKIGTWLVHAQCCQPSKRSKAISNAKSVLYNLRRALGPLHKETLAMSQLLAQLHVLNKRPIHAVELYEERLREIVTPSDDNRSSRDPAFLAEQASHDLGRLKVAYNQMKDQNTIGPRIHSLYDRVNNKLRLNTSDFGEWISTNEERLPTEKYIPPTTWIIEMEDDAYDHEEPTT